MSDHHEYCTGGYSPDDIVISGISGRLPHCQNVDELKEALLTSKNLLEQNNDRFEKGAVGLPFSSSGTLQDLDKFDAAFFGFSSIVANSTDPMQRKTLEVSYEAIVDAGYEPSYELKGANIGVYCANSNEDGKLMGLCDNLDGINNPNGFAGYSRCMLANRCSYVFDFHGPSYTVDSACSSSCVALSEAVQGIREGRIEAALVNCCEINITPVLTSLYYISGILSKTNEINPFDSRANGLVRAEGIVALFLQKASQARRAYATVMEIMNRAAGYVPEGIYVPYFKEEERLFRDVLKETNLTTKDIQYVEAHGTGTPVGDPIEVMALEKVYCEGRVEPLYIGSVKSNLGHSEASAGLTGILKAIFAFETGLVASNYGFKEPNPNCKALLNGTVQVVTENLPLTTPYIPVNSFGFGGSMVQAMLMKNPIEYCDQPAHQDLPRLSLFPATTEAAIHSLFDYIRNHPELRDEFFALLNKLSFSSTTWKPFRGYALFQNEKPVINIKNVEGMAKREVWFVMTGMGCQWPGMGLEMMRVKVFADSMRKSASILEPVGIDLFELLKKDTKHLITNRSITPAFVTIAAIQIALVDILRVLEIQPDRIIGHSTGELVCAYADGCCTAEQTILSAYWRGKSVESAGLEFGGMAAVGLTWEEATRRCPKSVFPACYNTDNSVTISGLKEPLEKFVAELQAENIFARVVDVYGYSFHCEHVSPASQALRAALSEIFRDPQPRSERWITTSYAEDEWEKEDCKLAGVEYFVHNLTSTVLFRDALMKIPSDAITIEIGPHFLLQSLLKRSIGPNAAYIGLMERNNDNNVGFFLESLGKLYLESLNPKIENLYSPVKFPVPRQTPSISSLIKWDYSQSWFVRQWKPFIPTYSREFHPESVDKYLLDHRIDGRSLFPAAGFVFLAWKALLRITKSSNEDTNIVIENFRIHRATFLDPWKPITFGVNILNVSGNFEIMEKNSVVASGRMYESKDMTFIEDSPEINRESSIFVPGEDIYNELRILGYEYGPEFRNLAEVSLNGKEGFVKWNNNWTTFIDALLLFFMNCKEESAFVVPTGVLSIKICPSILKKSVEECLSKNLPGLPVNFHSSSKICRTTGIEIEDMEVMPAPQRAKRDDCVLEEYRFVPYVHSLYSRTGINQDFQKYMIACNVSIDILQSKIHKDFSYGKYHVQDKIDFDVDSYIKEFNEEHTILSALKKMINQTNESPAAQTIEEISSPFVGEVEKDLTNKLLVNGYCLKLMFQIIYENTFEILEVLEIQNNFSVVLPTVIETVERLPIFKFKNKNLVFRNEEDIDKEKISNLNIELHKYTDLASIATQESQGVVIGAICTSTTEKAREHIRLLSFVVKKKGFILLFHKYCILPPESLLSRLAGKTINIIPPDILESWFEEEDLNIVSKISDKLCGSLYLLRRTAESVSRKIINISDDEAWFENLKSSVSDSSNVLWVVSEDCPNSGIIGMINCLKHEFSGDKLRCVYIPDRSKEEMHHFSFEDPFFQDILKKDLVMNVYRNGSWGSFRHSGIDKEVRKSEVDNSFMNIKKYGDLSSIVWMESAMNFIDVPDSKIVHIYYSALNFKDIMTATGKLFLPPPKGLMGIDKSQIGFEFAGRNKYGERVAGICKGRGVGTASEVFPEMTIKVPDHWSLEEAATIPAVYITCFYALIIRGNLQHGSSILIHCGTGGIGQAAINIALSMNCEIYTTVGTEKKREYLLMKFPSIKRENIGCSRDTSFKQMIMKRTNGKGVDVVLNSLADDKFQASLSCVGDHGKFLELGKYDLILNNKIGLKCFLKNIDFQSIVFDKVLLESLPVLKQAQSLLIEGIRNGVVKPLDRNVFQRDEIEKAFRYMAGGTHIGKILIKIREEEKEKCSIPQPLRLCAIPDTYFYSCKVYIVIGGLGGFGIEVSKWLLSKGAGTIVLTTRYGARTPYHQFCLKRWKDEGDNVIISTRDVSIKEEATTLLKEASEFGPIGGIFNSALVLHDSFLENMSLDNFNEVCAPKADATKHLDGLSRLYCPELDHFVCFSSMVCGRGNAGQMNYGYANSVMERVCEKRKADGLPGLAIQWGIIGDVGIVHRKMGEDAAISGLQAQRVNSCLEILSLSCQMEHPIVCSYVIRDLSITSGDQGDPLNQLARIFGLKDSSELSTTRNLMEMGLDSMVGVEVKQFLESTCDTSFTLQEIQQFKIDDLKKLLENSENKKKNVANSKFLASTALTSLPKSFIHLKSVEPLNDVQSGAPVFILDIDSFNQEQLKYLGKAIGHPAFALLLSKEAPMTDVSSLAAWYLQKITATSVEDVHILAHRTSSVVGLEMVLQSQKSHNKILNLTILSGVSTLLESLTRETKRSEADILCEFVQNYIPSRQDKLKETLSNAKNAEQQFRIIVDLFANNSKEVVDKTGLTSIVSSYLRKVQILEDYEPKGKLNVDLMVIEDSSKLLANDIAKVNKHLTMACSGSVTIQRIPDIENFNEESVQNITAAMRSVFQLGKEC